MRTKLIQTENYLLLIDEESEIKEGDTVYENISGVFAPYEKGDVVENPTKIIAYYPLIKEAKELNLPLLPNPFEMKISLENYLRNKLDEVESMHPFELATDTLRLWIDEYNENSHQYNVVDQRDQLRKHDVNSTLPISSVLEFGSKEWVDCCEQLFGGKPKNK